MKKLLIFTLFTLLVSVSMAFSQNHLRYIPYFIDANWDGVALEDVRSAHLDPRCAPKPDEKYEPAPAKIQSESGVELINISQSDQNQAETFIIINPKNPNHIVAASNDYRYINNRMSAFYSEDAGNTWNQSLTPNNRSLPFIDFSSGGGSTTVDPGLGFDSEGNIYYVYLFAQLFDGGEDGQNGVFVVKSTDGGKTWIDNIDDIGYPVINYTGSLQDKCFIGVDSDPNSPYKNRSYVAWFNTEYPYSVDFSYATDGIHFGGVTSINGSKGKSIQSPLPVVGPNGVLYVTWREGLENGSKTKAVVNKSTNGGQTWAWSVPKTAQLVNTSGDMVGSRRAFPEKDGMRVSSFPSMDVDLRNGNLYLVQSGKDDDDKYGVFLSKSTDGGETWTNGGDINTLKKIDGNMVGNDVFMPAVTVDPVTGMVAVLYYSSENDPENNTGCDVFVAVSFDDGETFKHIQLTDTWHFRSGSAAYAGSENLGRYWGDYTSIDAYNGKIYPCFWIPTSANANFQSCDLFTANLSTGPEIPVDLALEMNYEEPNKVTVVWTDPTTNKLGGLLTDFQIYIYNGGDKIGEVNKGVQSFTYDGLTPGENFTLFLKTFVPSTNEQSDLVSISGVAGGSLEPKLPTMITPRPDENGILLSWTNPVEHTDNTYLYDLNSIEIYANGEMVKSVSSPEIQAGETSSVLLDLTTEVFYEIQVKAKTKRGDFEGESRLSDVIIAYSGAPLATINMTFDDDGSVTPFYTNSDWAVTNTVSYSAPNCITDSPEGDYKSQSNLRLIIAPTIIQENQTTLQMAHIALVHKSDIAAINVSKDFGATWEGKKWLDVSHYDGWDQTGYDVNQSEWLVDGILNLSDYVGDTLFVMFELITNEFTNKDGWFIDDIKIGDYPVGVEDYSNLRAKLDMKLSPNPASDAVRFDFSLSMKNSIEAAIYDNIGKKIIDIENANLNPGNHSYNINTANLPNGAYYLRLSVDGNSDVMPLIIQK